MFLYNVSIEIVKFTPDTLMLFECLIVFNYNNEIKLFQFENIYDKQHNYFNITYNSKHTFKKLYYKIYGGGNSKILICSGDIDLSKLPYDNRTKTYYKTFSCLLTKHGKEYLYPNNNLISNYRTNFKLKFSMKGKYLSYCTTYKKNSTILINKSEENNVSINNESYDNIIPISSNNILFHPKKIRKKNFLELKTSKNSTNKKYINMFYKNNINIILREFEQIAFNFKLFTVNLNENILFNIKNINCAGKNNYNDNILKNFKPISPILYKSKFKYPINTIDKYIKYSNPFNTSDDNKYIITSNINKTCYNNISNNKIKQSIHKTINFTNNNSFIIDKQLFKNLTNKKILILNKKKILIDDMVYNKDMYYIQYRKILENIIKVINLSNFYINKTNNLQLKYSYMNKKINILNIIFENLNNKLILTNYIKNTNRNTNSLLIKIFKKIYSIKYNNLDVYKATLIKFKEEKIKCTLLKSLSNNLENTAYILKKKQILIFYNLNLKYNIFSKSDINKILLK